MSGEEELHAQAEVRLERLARLQTLTAELSAAATPADVAQIIFDRGLSLVGARVVALFWERSPGELELVHGLGVSEDFVQRYRRIEQDSPIPSAEVYRTGEPVWLGTVEELRRRFPVAAELALAEGDRAWAAIPLVADRSRGALSLRFETERIFDAEERDFIVAVSRQCAQALERARLFDAQRRLADRLASLQAITSELSAALTPREVAAVVLRHLLALGASGGVVLSQEQPGRLELVFAHAADELRDVFVAHPAALGHGGLDQGPATWLEGAQAVAAACPALGPAFAARGDGALGILPLRMEGRNVGVILAAFPEGKVPQTEDDRAFAGALAQQCAQALERARLYEAQRLQAERLAHLQSATAALSGAASAAEVAEMAHAALGRLGATTVELHAFAAPDRLVVVARMGEPVRGGDNLADASQAAAEVVLTGKALWLDSLEDLAGRFPELSPEPGKASWAVVPLLAGGATTGALAARLGRERLEPDERVFLRMLAMPCAQALERVRWAKAAALDQRAAEWLSALLEGALTAVPVGLALLDETMRVVRTSERLTLLAGVSQEAQRGRTLPEVFPGLPREALVEAFQRAMVSGERLDRVVSGETVAAAGETRRFVLRFYPVRVSGQIVGVGVLVHEAEQR